MKALSYGTTEMQKDKDTLTFTRSYGDEKIRARFRFEEPAVRCDAPVGEVLLMSGVERCDDGYIISAGGYIVEKLGRS